MLIDNTRVVCILASQYEEISLQDSAWRTENVRLPDELSAGDDGAYIPSGHHDKVNALLFLHVPDRVGNSQHDHAPGSTRGTRSSASVYAARDVECAVDRAWAAGVLPQAAAATARACAASPNPLLPRMSP
jgi:hypothetical protein